MDKGLFLVIFDELIENIDKIEEDLYIKNIFY